MSDQELPNKALNLSLAIYRVTAKLPINETLVNQMRQLANEVAGDLAAKEEEDIFKKINRLRVYFQIAQAQNWVKPINWAILDFEYQKLAQEINWKKKELTKEREEKSAKEGLNIVSHNIKEFKNSKVSSVVSVNDLPARQFKLWQEISRRGRAKLSELAPQFSGVSERTLRNDLQILIKNNLISKKGFNKTAAYIKK